MAFYDSSAAANHHHHQVHRFPQPEYIDTLRFLPHISPSLRHILLSTPTSLQTFSFSTSLSPSLSPLSSLPLPSRITSLKTSPSLIAASTLSGSLLFLSSSNDDYLLVLQSELEGVHVGPVSSIDLGGDGLECLSVGEDGRVGLVSVGEKVERKRVFDGEGLVEFRAVKWASPMEFVTGGLGFGLCWWDQRRPGGPVSQLKGNWGQKTSGIVHSVDIHPSRKHTCLAGGSAGTIFAWDLRWQLEPIILSSAESNDATIQAVSESDVWEVQYDNYIHSSNPGSISSSKILPAVMCSEDGILAVVEQGQEPVELLAEPCAINNFDIDKQNPSDIICSLEWESLVILTRP